MKSAKIKAVVFDWDGTLLDSFEHVCLAFDNTIEEFGGVPLRSLKKYRDIYSGNDWAGFARNQGVKDEKFQGFVKSLNSRRLSIQKEMKLFKDIVDVIVKIRRMRLKTGVVSGYFEKEISAHMKHLGIAELFDSVVGGDENKRKPDPELVFSCLRSIGARPEETCIVGDTQEDIATGRNAGVAMIIAVSYGYSPLHKLKGADAYARTPDDILEILGAKT